MKGACGWGVAGTINHGLKIVRRILNLAATEWMDEHGLTWLDRPPKIRMLPDVSKRQPYPLSWDEQERLFKELPRHLANVALFALNTGCRDQEICGLKWDWEVLVPELETSLFIIPAAYVKNGDERLVVLNRKARSVLQEVRGQNREYVFSYKGKRISKDYEQCVAACQEQGRPAALEGARLEAHLRAASTRSGCVLRGSSRPLGGTDREESRRITPRRN